ncbi:hypothetical protein KL918_002454 [Ogataea parapolymorpha]|uniref:DUF7593 domain-containing protein n=1 Tax=Ogataea parapolymorpha (strain ATCC 26012 / BCRC 20466 / JCM 22074 / NRRL Y-7560 / DL-1) TaxID=871575 RepID=W1QLL9_OGAPD|nr:hypothetical protein HPODL_02097 [Ogataea parapolymorpha DL-1]ESX02774.1 hypothetical protein HPODL_02097 [Ogataea parapolymorpha DL-1]KAG7867857.1 hypothetical protein KL918_002454 [Ogataea parapolymorpha]KAG7870702.1 hypothetical protein KL916_004750 [Ogataea parapolymorpha]
MSSEHGVSADLPGPVSHMNDEKLHNVRPETAETESGRLDVREEVPNPIKKEEPLLSESETDIDESIPLPSNRTRRLHCLMRRSSDENDSDDEPGSKKQVQKRSASQSSRSSERKVSGRSGKDASGRSLLQRHCAKGHYDEAKQLIENGADVNEADFAGNTPLHEAALEGYLDVVELLLDNGADINAQSAHIDKDTPLIDAASNLHYDVVRTLLDRGANPCLVNSQGDSALDSVERDRDLNDLEEEELDKVKKLKKLLAQATREYKKKHARSQSSGPGTDSEKEEVSKRSSAVFFDPFSKEGRSEIYHKVSENDVTFVLNYVSNLAGSRISPDLLCLAAKHGHTDIASLLIAFGAKVNYVDKNGMTPLMHAVGKDHIDMVKLLLENKADVSLMDKHGRTAIDILQESYVPDDEEMRILKEASQKSTKKRKERAETPENDRKKSDVKKIKHRPSTDSDTSVRSAPQTPAATRVPTPVKQEPKPEPKIQPKREEKPLPPTPEELEERRKQEEEARKAREALELQRLERKKARQQQIARTIAEQERKRNEELRAAAMEEERRKQQEEQERARRLQEEEQRAQQEAEKQNMERKQYIRSYYPYGLKIARFDGHRTETEISQYLPLYVFEVDGESYLVDLQAILILGTEKFYDENSDIERKPLTKAEKARVWNMLWPMIGVFLKGDSVQLQELRKMYETEEKNFEELVLNWIKLSDFDKILENSRYAVVKQVYERFALCKVAPVEHKDQAVTLPKTEASKPTAERAVPLRLGPKAKAVLQTFDRKLW